MRMKVKRIIVIAVGLLWGMGLMAQSGKSPYKGADKKQYDLAKALLDFAKYEEDFQDALDILTRLESIDSTYAPIMFDLGLCYFKMRGHDEEAKNWLQMAREAGQTEAYFYLAKLNHSNYAIDEAIKLLRYYKLREDHKVENSVIERAGFNRRADRRSDQ